MNDTSSLREVAQAAYRLLEQARAARDRMPHGPERQAVNAALDFTDMTILAALAAQPEPAWPKARDVGRLEDMSPKGFLRIGLDGDNDVYVHVCREGDSASVEFCNGGGGGGRSMRTRMALIALMVAMEADNAERPDLDWWALRMGSATQAKEGRNG